jgi:hypothetical protein
VRKAKSENELSSRRRQNHHKCLLYSLTFPTPPYLPPYPFSLISIYFLFHSYCLPDFPIKTFEAYVITKKVSFNLFLLHGNGFYVNFYLYSCRLANKLVPWCQTLLTITFIAKLCEASIGVERCRQKRYYVQRTKLITRSSGNS